MKKKTTLSIISVLTVLSIVLLCPLQLLCITANAQTEYTEGYYTYTVTDGETKIINCKSPVGDIEIPSSLGGCPVTDIGTMAFFNCTSMTSVIIPDSVKNIGVSAFYNCTSLKSVSIPNSVISIGDSAFSHCISMTSVAIPDSVKSIGTSAFYNCKSLKGVYITDIAAWCSTTFNSSFANPLCYAKNLYLNGELVTDLEIPDGVTNISKNAFYNCTAMTSVAIPDSIKNIGSAAFDSCLSLKSVYITDMVAWCNTTFNSSTANPLCYAKNLYLNGELVTDLKIPDGVTSIRKNAFYNCEAITSVTIPDSIKDVEDSAFYNCKSLKGVYITDLSAWCNIYFGDETANPLYYAKNLYLNREPVTNLVIPNGVTVIKKRTFDNCQSLISVEIPNSVTKIDEQAFNNCKSLKGVYITDIAAWCTTTFNGSTANPLYYAENLYLNGKLVTDLEIPDGVKSIGKFAFYKCDSITAVTISDSVESIGLQAFRYCKSLKTITIPESVTEMQYSAFADCESLETITLSEGITEIGDSAFSGCKSLKAVTIPESVKRIGYNAFFMCTSLERVDIADFEVWNEIVFGTSYSNPMYYAGNLYVNNQLLTELRVPRVQTISMYQYCGYKCIENVFLPETVTLVDIGAFYDCTGIKNVYFEGSVEEWKNIRIYGGNEKITSAEIYFNYGKEIDASPTAENLVSATQTLLNGYNDLLIDYSGDGKINILDLVILKKKIAEDTN